MLMAMRRLSLGQRGDTIVEVTIAIGLLASMLLLAYSLSNLAAQQGIAAREQDQATQVLQYQAEGIRYARDNADEWSDFSAEADGEFHVTRSGDSWELASGRVSGNQLFDDSYNRYETWADTVSVGPGADRRDIVIYVEWENIWGDTQTSNVDTVLANVDPIAPPDDLPGAPEPQPVPDPPQNLTAFATGSDSIRLEWDAVSDPEADSYRIERDGDILDSESSGSAFDDTGFDFDPSGLEPETQYTYRVKAVNEDGLVSDWSNTASATTLPEEINVTFDATSTGRDGDIQEWEVPETGEYRITAYGAQGGGTRGGLGARMSGTFDLNAGQTLRILVGQRGEPGGGYISTGNNNAAGGGGSFVVDANDNPLIIAGGGGAAHGSANQQNNAAGVTTEAGADGSSGNQASCSGGNGGSGGQGTCASSNNVGFEGGAGFTGDGSNNARAFLNGGQGGSEAAEGGFGGGGAVSSRSSWSRLGGGGGYSGGGASIDSTSANNHAAGGGGSFNAGAQQSNSSGANLGHGSVEIESVWDED